MIFNNNFNVTLGKDLIKNFKLHFGRILIKNYRVYKFRKCVYLLFKKIKFVKSVITLFSKLLFKKLGCIIIQRVKRIQKFYKHIINKKMLIIKFNLIQKVLVLRNKFTFISFNNRLKISKIKKNNLIKKSKRLLSKIYKISQQIYLNYYIDHTKLYASKLYYATKIKLKLLLILVNNILC
jgi:hypothetical protein